MREKDGKRFLMRGKEFQHLLSIILSKFLLVFAVDGHHDFRVDLKRSDFRQQRHKVVFKSFFKGGDTDGDLKGVFLFSKRTKHWNLN